MNTERTTTLKSSKLVTPLSLIMLSSEKLKSTIFPVTRANMRQFHKKNMSLPIRPCEIIIKGTHSARNSKNFGSDLLFFSRITGPSSRLKSANPVTKRKILKYAYTGCFKGNNKTQNSEIFQNERIRKVPFFDNYSGPAARVNERQLGIMLNSVLGKPGNTGNYNEEKKN